MFSIANEYECNECVGSYSYANFIKFSDLDDRDMGADRGSTPSGGFPGWRANVYKSQRLKRGQALTGGDGFTFVNRTQSSYYSFPVYDHHAVHHRELLSLNESDLEDN